MSLKPRDELAEGEVISEAEIFWSDQSGTSVDVWKVVTDPSRPNFFRFWFDRTETIDEKEWRPWKD